MPPSGETAAAILLLAACPVGDIANAYTARLTTAAILLLLAMVLANPASRPNDLAGTIGSAAVFLVLSAALCTAFLRMLRRNPGEKTAILLCLPVRNVGIAAPVAVNLLGETRMLGATAVYFALEAAIFLPFAVWLGRRAMVTASS